MSFGKWFSQSNKQFTLPRFLLYGLFFLITIIVIVVVNAIEWNEIFLPIQDFVFQQEDNYHQWLSQQSTNNPFFLLCFAFVGGFITSVSPCKLALLSVNLSYIGTCEIKSRRDAFLKASAFVLGVVTVLSVLGLFSAVVGAFIAQFQGYIYIVAGALILLMGLNLLNIVRLPLPQSNFNFAIASPYTVGLTFALVGSPCSSPVLFAVLTAAAASGSVIQSTLTMISYALGSTALIFFASLFTGLAKQSRILSTYSEWILRVGSLLLIIIGGYYLVNGVHWVILVHTYSG